VGWHIGLGAVQIFDWVEFGILVLTAITALGTMWLWPRGSDENNAGNDWKT